MAYVDHAFSISDEDIMMDSPHVIRNRAPIKEIALAVALLVFGSLSILVGIIMAYNRAGGDKAHGVLFAVLGSLLFLPGFYYTRIAYYAYKGYKGFSFENIPPVKMVDDSLGFLILASDGLWDVVSNEVYIQEAVAVIKPIDR